MFSYYKIAIAYSNLETVLNTIVRNDVDPSQIAKLKTSIVDYMAELKRSVDDDHDKCLPRGLITPGQRHRLIKEGTSGLMNIVREFVKDEASAQEVLRGYASNYCEPYRIDTAP